MRKIVLGLVVLSLVCFLSTAPAQAQATRTWVSGVGDDANPCSRTAPCKTFAGAISKTAAFGEINVLDPGGFGGVTITKSITISSEGFEAGVLVSGTNAIIINAAATDFVVLRGLDIEGLGTGLDGVKILGAGSVHIENCTINDFSGFGIEAVPSTTGVTRVFIKDTQVRYNGASHGTGGTGGGIQIGPAVAPNTGIQASLENVRMERNSFGIKAQGGTIATNVTVFDSVASGNQFAGFATSGNNAVLTIERSIASHNSTGLNCAAGGTLRIGNMSLVNNATTLATGGTCQTFKNNDIDVPGIPGLTQVLQQ